MRPRTGPPFRGGIGYGRLNLSDRRHARAVHFGARRTTGIEVAERPVPGTRGGGRGGRMAGRVSHGSGERVLDLPISAAPGGATREDRGPERLSAGAGPGAPGPALPPFRTGQSGGSQSALPECLCFEIAADSERLRGGGASLGPEWPWRRSGIGQGVRRERPGGGRGSPFVAARPGKPGWVSLFARRGGNPVGAERGCFGPQ